MKALYLSCDIDSVRGEEPARASRTMTEQNRSLVPYEVTSKVRIDYRYPSRRSQGSPSGRTDFIWYTIRASCRRHLFDVVSKEGRTDFIGTISRILRRSISFLYLGITAQSLGMALADHQILNTLSLDEKIGQLCMVAAIAHPATRSKVSELPEPEIMNLIEHHHIGGIIYLERSTPEEQLAMTQRLKAFNRLHNKIELWVGADAEWGPAMRLDNTIKFPFNLTLGAVQDDSLISELGSMIGDQLKSLGAAINFAPVVDTNTNPNNPVINRRSFGQDPIIVAQKAFAYAQGLTQAGIIACAKHFPGHGDTTVDSHKGLPVIKHKAQRLEAVELYPFRELIDKGIQAIMVGHLLVPAFDATQPATLSRSITTDLLKNRYHFNGLIITDGLDMGGVTEDHQPGLIELGALQAGADLLLIPVDAPKAIEIIKNALTEGKLSAAELDEHVLHIIHAKRLYAQHEGCSPDEIHAKLNSPEAKSLSKKLYQKAITIVRNEQNSIPLKPWQDHVAVILIGSDNLSPFAAELSSYKTIPPCYISQNPSDAETALARITATGTDSVIIGLSGLTYQAGSNFGISQATLGLIKCLQMYNKQVILVIFGNPYALTLFKDFPGVIEAYENHPYAQQAAARVIMGAIKAEGKLPVTA